MSCGELCCVPPGAVVSGQPCHLVNRSLQREDLDEHDWDEGGVRMLRAGMERGVLTGRGFDRVRRVARTIADLEGSDQVSEGHTAEALGLRAHL